MEDESTEAAGRLGGGGVRGCLPIYAIINAIFLFKTLTY